MKLQAAGFEPENQGEGIYVHVTENEINLNPIIRVTTHHNMIFRKSVKSQDHFPIINMVKVTKQKAEKRDNLIDFRMEPYTLENGKFDIYNLKQE